MADFLQLRLDNQKHDCPQKGIFAAAKRFMDSALNPGSNEHLIAVEILAFSHPVMNFPDITEKLNRLSACLEKAGKGQILSDKANLLELKDFFELLLQKGQEQRYQEYVRG